MFCEDDKGWGGGETEVLHCALVGGDLRRGICGVREQAQGTPLRALGLMRATSHIAYFTHSGSDAFVWASSTIRSSMQCTLPPRLSTDLRNQ